MLFEDECFIRGEKIFRRFKRGRDKRLGELTNPKPSHRISFTFHLKSYLNNMHFYHFCQQHLFFPSTILYSPPKISLKKKAAAYSFKVERSNLIKQETLI